MINVQGNGAAGDGMTLNTPVLQRMIDRCAEAGGGTLLFPPGRYLTGGLILRSRVNLFLEGGAVLLGSPDPDHYPLWKPAPEIFIEGQDGVRALLAAVDEEDIHIYGQGTIDGQGGLFERFPDLKANTRPRNIWFTRCRRVSVDGITLRCSGFWMQHYLKCEQLRLSNLTVWNHGGTNNDGIDVDSCRDVIVSGCRVDSSDDAICLKSTTRTPCENVLISDCITASHCNHVKTGTESNGGFRNIRVHGIIMKPSEQKQSHHATLGADWRGACGIALGCVDGGFLENIEVRAVTMDQIRVPFFVRLGDRGRAVPGQSRQPPGFARNVAICSVRARGASAQGCYLAGLLDAPLADVWLDDLDLEFEGGGCGPLTTQEVPECRQSYPSMEMFGALPSFGIFFRDIRGLRTDRLRLSSLAHDPRPAMLRLRCES